MRHMKFYDSTSETYALKEFLFDGVVYQRGDSFDVSDLPKLTLERLFGLWYIGHEDDVKKRTTTLVGLFKEPLEDTTENSDEDTEETDLEDETVEIVEDTEESFKVMYKGQVRELKRNQVRGDGTLTKGGLKAFQ